MATKHPVSEMLSALRKNVNAGRMCRALDILDTMTADKPKLADRARELRENYRALVNYALAGIEDVSRDRMIADIGGNAVELGCSAVHSSLREESSSIYFSKWRFEHYQAENLQTLVESYERNCNALAITLFGGHKDCKSETGESLTEVNMRIGERIFNNVWTAPALSGSDMEVINHLLQSQTIGEELKEQIVWALMLGGLEYYCINRILLTGGVYVRQENSRRLRLAGLTAFMILAERSSDLQIGSKLCTLLDLMRDVNGWHEDVGTVATELMRSRDTARISQKIRDEIFPTMIKLRPDLEKLGERREELLTGDNELNPEWEELLDKSGLGDKMRELGELQNEGADMMMATFSGLKGYPFFNEVCNWFIPFSLERPEVARELNDELGTMVGAIASTPLLCDSDKYSIVMSMQRIPKSQRDMFVRQIKEHEISIADLQTGSLDRGDKAGVATERVIVQNLYRFFKLYRRKNEFADPFEDGIDMMSVPLLYDELHTQERVITASEFYFKRGYYEDALKLYNEILDVTPDNASILQKAGYCHSKMGNLDRAIEFYERSEAIHPGSAWTLRKLAGAYRLRGDIAKALDCYRKLELQKPEDVNIALYIGHCLLELGDITGALKMYYKVDYLSPQSDKAKRPIAWCAFLTGDYEKSRTMYHELLNNNPQPVDSLNFGHLSLACGSPADAVIHYREYVRQKGVNAFEKSLEEDLPVLLKRGVDKTLINIVADEVLN